MLQLYKQLFNTNTFFIQLLTHYKQLLRHGPETLSRADMRCTRLQMALRVFFVSIGTLGWRKFGGRENSSFFTHPKRVVPRQVWKVDKQQLLLQVVSEIFPSQNEYQIPIEI